ncbi:PLC-like phosphodiesterase [Nemania abortiva]|nr:PLC-like phosphodiesterase [Nemania abortiva]
MYMSWAHDGFVDQPPRRATVPPWVRRRDTEPGPRAVGHRGYKAAYPENTMAAFRGAIEVGASAIETDLHLSKDEIIVLSHDATLKRCFGDARRVADCNWDELSKLQTLREPKQSMPRLLDLLEYLAQPEQEHIWLLLDIKMDDNMTKLLSRLADTIESVPKTTRPWKQHVILCPWNAEWVAGCLRYLPGFPITLIAFSPSYATAMLQVPNLNFNLFNYSFATPSGRRFLREAKQRGRLVFSWSDNQAEWMARSICNEVDAVITDDPKQFLELCGQSSSEVTTGRIRTIAAKWSVKEIGLWILINFLVWVSETVSGVVRGSPRSQVKKILGV